MPFCLRLSDILTQRCLRHVQRTHTPMATRLYVSYTRPSVNVFAMSPHNAACMTYGALISRRHTGHVVKGSSVTCSYVRNTFTQGLQSACKRTHHQSRAYRSAGQDNSTDLQGLITYTNSLVYAEMNPPYKRALLHILSDPQRREKYHTRYARVTSSPA